MNVFSHIFSCYQSIATISNEVKQKKREGIIEGRKEPPFEKNPRLLICISAEGICR
jgi:hypothetical protein